MEIMTQRIELLAVSPGESPSGEKAVVLTIRADRGSFRPHNIALSRSQAIRLLRSLRTVLRQSASVLLLGLGLSSVAGCSAEVQVVTEKTAPRADAETAPSATEERMKTDVALRLLDKPKPTPVEQQAAKSAAVALPPEPRKPVEIVGDGNSVVVVEGDLHVHQHRHIHIQKPPRSEHVEVEIRRHEAERDERCERLHRQYEEKVRELKRLFNQ